MIGLPPIDTMGFGIKEVSSDNLLPKPPANITAFTLKNIYKKIITYKLIFLNK